MWLGGEWRRLGPRCRRRRGASRVERRRREDRGAERAEGVGPFPEKFSIFELKMVSYGAFWD